jgi:predicted Holliday junction resolvase-like endonuclease
MQGIIITMIILLIIMMFIIAFLAYRYFILTNFMNTKEMELIQIRESVATKITEARQDSLQRSRNTMLGQIMEHLAPNFWNLPINPKDARFIGSPIDYIAFPGLTETGKITEVVLIEVKTGNARESASQINIRKLVENKNIKYELVRLKTE